jgi:hypothetical protein
VFASRKVFRKLVSFFMNFAVRPTLSNDLNKIVLVAVDPHKFSGVFALVACDDIRTEFCISDASNEVLRQRASIRQTNKEALGNIANRLFAIGRYSIEQGLCVIKISRSDLATKREGFAWGRSDLPPILGIPEQKPTNVRVAKFVGEKSKVERLLRLSGWNNVTTFDPNQEQETGIDVGVDCDGRRIGFQVTDFHSDEGVDPTRKGSELRRQESTKVHSGLPAAMCVPFDPIPGLVQRISDKSKKRWSKKDFPEANLLIATSIPEFPGIVSTLNEKLSALLESLDYSAVYILNIMQGIVYRWTKASDWERLV